MQDPVFIIGGSRTGSEMLKTMLSASPNLDFVDELFLLCPRWLHTDLDFNIRKHVGSLDATDVLDRLIDFLYSGIPYGWFWSVAEEQLDRRMLRNELAGRPLSLESLFRAIMVVHSRMRNKVGIGAKFPIHYSQTQKLIEWFPNSRLIHTTRNPKAVFASQSVKYLRDREGSIARAIEQFKQFVHINIQTTWTARLHRQLCELPNYRLIRYEDVVTAPEEEVRGICEYLGVEYMPEMLEPKQYGSSFDSIGGGNGVDDSSLERWRAAMSPVTAAFFDISHRKAFRLLGYAGNSSKN